MIQLPIWGIILGCCVGICLVAFLAWAYFTAQRLHRMHERVNNAAAVLNAALDERARACRSAARALLRHADSAGPDVARTQREEAETLREAAATVMRVASASLIPLEDREDPENELTLLLLRIDFDQVKEEEISELRDCMVRVTLARRFYNTAVRETIALQTSAMVSFFHLAGHAGVPRFFNIVEQPAGH